MRAPRVLSLLALVASGCLPRAPGNPVTPAPPGGARLLDDLAMLAVGAPLPPARLRLVQQRLAAGESTLEGYVDELLADPRFARNVAPELVFNKKAVDLAEEDPWEVLGVTAGAAPVYYLRRPCAPGEAVSVHPWWALDTEVLVCPDSYQPTHLRDEKTGWYCGGSNLAASRSPFCGCGPNLMSCARDDAQNAEMKSGLREELLQTVAHVVARDLPLSRLFTMNETVRTGYSELFYQRWQVIRGERAAVSDVRAWSGDGKLLPRPESTPGQHAGLLTAPHLLLYGDTPRARLRNDFNDLWCVAPASVDVTTEQVLGLGVTDLRDGDGWKKLAVMPVCTECHARLDHGMQFFSGYPSSFVGVVYEGRDPGHERGLLFGDGAGDLRGEGPRSPLGFAGLAVEQAEFSRCMVRDVTDHVWNGNVGADDRGALLEAFRKEGTLKAIMREALLRFARRAPAREAAPADTGAARAVFEARCKSCHGGGEAGFPRDGAWSKELTRKMLAQVAWRRMPRAPASMPEAERRALVRGLIAASWDDEASRREATRYFDGGMRGLPAHRGTALLGMVESRAAAHDDEASSWTFSDADRHDAVEYGPSFAITFAMAALRTCKAAGHTGRALEACLERALDVEASVKARPWAPAPLEEPRR